MAKIFGVYFNWENFQCTWITLIMTTNYLAFYAFVLCLLDGYMHARSIFNITCSVFVAHEAICMAVLVAQRACYFSFSGKRMVERARDWMGGYGLCLCIKCKPKC